MNAEILLAATLLLALGPLPAAGEPPGETFGIKNASLPEPGMLAAGQPTGEQLQVLAEEGYKTVIDLRPAEEPRGFDEAQAARQNGLAYVHLPVSPATLDQTTLDRFFEEFEKAPRPVVVHCATSNRVGALYFAYLTLKKGMPEAEALEKAKAAGLTSPELAAKIQGLVAERKPKP
jgi:uncharacterized protein (TIGR01244 family)